MFASKEQLAGLMSYGADLRDLLSARSRLHRQDPQRCQASGPARGTGINTPHQRSDTLMQLSRSTTQRSALRRTAGPYILARLRKSRRRNNFDSYR